MQKKLLDILDQFPRKKIVVVGDLIADEFLYGQISRVSREAPVLVLEYENLVRPPGGAANAANNLLDLGCRTVISGIAGQDEPGKSLVAILRGKGADIRALRRIRSYSTPIKTRILSGAHHSAPQQIVRIDRIRNPISRIQPSWDLLLQKAQSADGIIVSDYGYGAIVTKLYTRLSEKAERKGIPIVVDSRFRMSEFPNATAMTPNITELEASTGVSIGADPHLLRKTGQRVLCAQRHRSLLVRQGRFGMTLFKPRKTPLHIPI